jgi:hypothetical protein
MAGADPVVGSEYLGGQFTVIDWVVPMLEKLFWVLANVAAVVMAEAVGVVPAAFKLASLMQPVKAAASAKFCAWRLAARRLPSSMAMAVRNKIPVKQVAHRTATAPRRFFVLDSFL